MVRWSKNLFLSALSTLASTAVVSQSLAETLVIQGSTTFARRIEPYKAMIEAFSKHELTLIPNKTVPGLVALIEGRAHMAMTSAPLKNEIEVLKTTHPRFSRINAWKSTKFSKHELLSPSTQPIECARVRWIKSDKFYWVRLRTGLPWAVKTCLSELFW